MDSVGLKKRTSKSQFTIYLKYLQQNKTFISGKLHPTSDPQELEHLWTKLSTELNSCGDGPVRDVAAWKKVFTEWKSSSRKKARENKPLSDLEAVVVALTGSGAVTGLDLTELGTSNIWESSLTISENMIQEIPSCSTNNETGTEKVLTTHIEKKKLADKTKPKRKGTGDILCDTYTKAVSDNGKNLEGISKAILEVAKAIHRYCDIAEASNNTTEVHYVSQEGLDNSNITEPEEGM